MYDSHAAQLCEYRYSNVTAQLALSSVPCMTAMLHSYVNIVTVM